MRTPALTRFDRDTAVTALGEGVYEARIDGGWWVVAGPNGGYLAAILCRAFAAAVDDASRTPRSLTIHYTRPPKEGPARIETTVERAGRSLTTVTARLLQEDALQAVAIAAFSKGRPGPDLHHAVMPEVPPPEACPTRDSIIPIHDRFEQRMAIGAPPKSGQGREALTGGWIRPAEPRPLDGPLVAALADAWPPAVFSCAELGGVSGGVPTVDLTVHFRAALPRPETDPADYSLVVFRTREVREGFLEEDGEIWSRDGVLLAQSRQLAIVR